VVAKPLAQPGQQLILPPADHVSGRYAYAVVRGACTEACDAAAQAAERAFTLTVGPAQAAQPAEAAIAAPVVCPICATDHGAAPCARVPATRGGVAAAEYAAS